uniref:SCP domain-containing protein n=1 Tax=Strongyloides stercoralis TaxID=6248 RepID=A0AAF5D7X9_STRER
MTLESVDLVVQYSMRTTHKGKRMYNFNGKDFCTKENMIVNIKKKYYKVVPQNHLLLDLVSIDEQGLKARKNKGLIYEKIKGLHTEMCVVPKNDVLIFVYLFHRRIIYECNGNMYYEYIGALQNALRITEYEKFVLPSKLLGNNLKSNLIWKSVWKSCSYRCFSKNSFDILKIKFYEEINKYRKAHYKKKLKFSPLLSKYADLLAKKLSKLKTLESTDTKSDHEVSGSMSAVMVNLLVKRWYDKYSSYKPGENDVSQVTRKFQVLLNPLVYEIGIGVFEKGSMVYVYDVKVIRGRTFFIYCGCMYATKVDMVEAIKDQLRNKNIHHFILALYPKISKGCRENLKKNKPIFETILMKSAKHGEKKSYEVKQHHNPDGSTCYRCGDKVFQTHESAIRYSRIKQTKLIFTSEKVQEFKKKEPPNQVSINRKVVTNPQKDAEKIRKELEKKHIPNVLINGVRFSNIIWKKIWSDCTYDVYSRHNYFGLKQKFLKEINTYRRFHNVDPLTKNHKLENTAQWCANKYLTKKRPMLQVNEKFNLLVGKIGYLNCPILVKYWYDEESTFEFNHPNGTTNTEHFSQLIWKGTKEVGIGVIKKREDIFVVFLFNPRGNIPNEYDKNVFRRKIKG